MCIYLIIGAPKYRKQKLTELENEIDNSMVTVREIIIFSQQFATTRKNCRKDIDLRNSTTLLVLTPKQRTVEYTFFSSDMEHTDGLKTDHTVDLHKSQLVQKGKGSHRIVCDHNKTQLQINNCEDFYRNSKNL